MKRSAPCTTRTPTNTAGTPIDRYAITYSTDRTPARSCGAASGTTVRMAPWNPEPNPAPATAVPRKNSPTAPSAVPISVSATPAISAADPISRIVRAGRVRDNKTVTAPEPAITNSTAPPSTSDDEPASRRTSDGPSDP